MKYVIVKEPNTKLYRKGYLITKAIKETNDVFVGSSGILGHSCFHLCFTNIRVSPDLLDRLIKYNKPKHRR